MTDEKPTIGFIGAGRAGTTLSLALHKAGYTVGAVYSRTQAHAQDIAERTGATLCNSAGEVAGLSRIIFLTVPDGFIAIVANKLEHARALSRGSAVVHTSGMLTRMELRGLEPLGVATGVFHPLQALSGVDSARSLRTSYIGLDAEDDLMHTLETMTYALSAYPLDLRGIERVPYHLAAAVASNLTLVLISDAINLMVESGVPEEAAMSALARLVEGSVHNLERSGFNSGLTGPVARGDVNTVRSHLTYLRGHSPELARVYASISRRMLQALSSTPNADALHKELARCE